MSIDATKAVNAQQFMNLLFYMVVNNQGGSITLTKEELQSHKMDEVGALQIEHNEDESVTLKVVDRETIKAFTDSLTEEHH